MPVYLDTNGHLIRRTARKPHTCYTFRRPTRADGLVCPKPDGIIQPGERYAEYIGETPAYKTGDAYCAECAKLVWDVDV